MTRRATWWIAAASAAGVLLAALPLLQRHSPGPIAAVHAGVDALAGGEACAACHGGLFGTMRAACNGCHVEIDAQLLERRGLHGSFDAAQAAACGDCHGEHHGAGFVLVNRLAFSQAGFADREAFDHRRIGFEMRGKHTSLACAECHANADKEVLAAGERRFLGLLQDCGSCHRDPHQGRMQFGCTTCHDQQSFQRQVVESHARWLPLTGAHGTAGCRACHAATDGHALERLLPGAATAARQCGDCHATPHNESFVAGVAAAAGLPAGAACNLCHRVEAGAFAAASATVSAEQHAHAGFPLAKPHDRAACAACHAPDLAYAERHPGRGADDCASCHQDPHQGQFAADARWARGCIACHDHDHFTPPAFGPERHAATALPLDGAHAELQCKACHLDPEPAVARRFTGTPSRCEQCHQDAHAGAFAAAAASLPATPRGECARCHDTGSFAAVPALRFDHAAWTGFGIDGAHAEVDCEACHRPTPEPDATGRRFGRIEAPAPAAPTCTVCHQDPHGDAFAGAPATIDGRQGCRRCHDTASFRALTPGFDHGASTGFLLAGRHAEAACSACHARLPAPDAHGRSWQHARGRDCADCHADPHQGQFERLGRVDCARCHKSITTFAALSFRHNLDARFQLGAQHAEVPCASCHETETRGGKPFVRYRPLPTACVDCHGTEQGGAGASRRRM
ncbi:MAG: cytochrome c3 family protein [Planctomycetes bacterium]|nr:cytochrome c3 family protein [Planctomycetota bacterium]